MDRPEPSNRQLRFHVPDALYRFYEIRRALRAVVTAERWQPLAAPSRLSSRAPKNPPFVPYKGGRNVAAYPYDQIDEHGWWRNYAFDRRLHPAVKHALEDGHMPDAKGGLHNLVLEAPRISDDGTRLAYIQSDAKGVKNLWTVTSPGKYLTARWTYLPDHMIRDYVARAGANGVQILHTVKDIVSAVQFGPSSCMQWDSGDAFDSDAYDDWEQHHPDADSQGYFVANPEQHPYACYDPEYGWRAAVIRDGARFTHRALVLHHSRGPWTPDETLKGSVYVRSYGKDTGDGYSSSSTMLEAWLKGQGVTHVGRWPNGAKLAMLDHPGGNYTYLLPYIDGDRKTVEARLNHMTITEDGTLNCANTDGGYDEIETRYCEHCEERVVVGEDDDSGGYVGSSEDTWVCESCLRNSFQWVRGARSRWGGYREYYVHEEEAVEVDGRYYDQTAIDDGEVDGIVQLDNGDYESTENAFCCPINDAWYHVDDGVNAEDREELVHRDNAWLCAATGNWYSNDIKPVEIDGETYHPDHVPDDGEYDKPEGAMANTEQLELEVA